MKRILYTQDNGVVAVIVPSGAIEDCIKDVPAGKEYEIVDVSEIPSDRTYRNAWVKDGKKIKIDAVKKAKIDADKAKAEVDKLIEEKAKDLALKELIKDGILDADGKKAQS